jgi:hypothetical protein
MAALLGAENPPPVDESRGSGIEFIDPKHADANLRAAKQLHRDIGSALYAVAGGTTLDRDKWLRAAASGLREVTVLTEMQLGPDGRLQYLHRYLPTSDKAVIGLLYAFLLDPEQRIRERLRMCAYPGCARFYLDEFGEQGGGVSKYCGEHRAAAQRESNAERQRKYRGRHKAARKHK